MTKKEFARECTACGKGMNEGYCIEGGIEYYCSDACLHTEITPEEWLELYNDGEGDSYYTDWSEDPDNFEDEDEVDTCHARDCSIPELTAEVERLSEGNKRLRAALHDLLNATEPTYDNRHEIQAAQDALEEGSK
jgi:hypothetical protein